MNQPNQSNPLFRTDTAAPGAPMPGIAGAMLGAMPGVAGAAANATNVGGPRSIIERMTNPSPADLQAGEGVKSLGRTHIENVIEAFTAYLCEHRTDIDVSTFSDDTGHGWKITMRDDESTFTTAQPKPPL